MAMPQVDDDQDENDKEVLGIPTDAGATPSVPDAAPLLKPKDLEAIREDNRNQAILGALADKAANRQSFGNVFLGRQAPHVDASSAFKANIAANNQQIGNAQLAQQQVLQAPKLDMARQAIDPTSIYSRGKQAEARATFNMMVKAKMLDQDAADKMSENLDKMNGYQVGQMLETNPALKQTSDVMKSQAMMALMGQRIANQSAGIDLRRDDQAANAAGKFDNDELMKASSSQLQQIQIDRHTIQSSPTITPQMLHEISNGIASALNKGKAVGLGMAEMQDLSTSQTKWAALMQQITNSPQDGASPEIRKQVLDTLDRLEDAYQRTMGSRAKQLAIGKEYASNPKAQKAVKDKVQSYQPVPTPSPAPQDAGEDKAALDWAKANPTDPRAAKILLTIHGKLGGQ